MRAEGRQREGKAGENREKKETLLFSWWQILSWPDWKPLAELNPEAQWAINSLDSGLFLALQGLYLNARVGCPLRTETRSTDSLIQRTLFSWSQADAVLGDFSNPHPDTVSLKLAQFSPSRGRPGLYGIISSEFKDYKGHV